MVQKWANVAPQGRRAQRSEEGMGNSAFCLFDFLGSMSDVGYMRVAVAEGFGATLARVRVSGHKCLETGQNGLRFFRQDADDNTVDRKMDTSVTRMDMRMKTQNAIEDSQKNDSLFRLASVASLACLVWAMLMSGNLVSAADSVICVQNSIAMEQLNWNYNLSVPAFDSTLGQLNSVTLTLTATLSGSVYVENESANPVDFTALLNAEVDLGDTNTSPAVLQATPFITIDQPLDAFDGNEDFGGTSGAVIEGLTNIQVVATTFTNAADLAAFAAGFAYPVAAYGDSSYVGGGTMVTIFLSSAQADLNVCYSYTPVAQGAGLLAAHLTATPLCSGQSCNLTVTAVNGAGGPYRAVWTGPNSLNTTTTSANLSQSLTVSAAGTYIVTVTDLLSGLVAKATNVVTAFPVPTCTITAGPAPAPGSAVNFIGVDAGTNAVSCLWSLVSSTGPGWLINPGTVNNQYVVYAAGSSGTATFKVLVTTPAGCSSFCTVTIAAAPLLTLSCVSVTTGQVGLSYASSLAASGGTPAYTYSISSGSLPPGLTLNPTTGAITGTPTTAGNYAFTAQASDSAASPQVATVNCSINITVSVPGVVISHGDTATIGFWKNKNGQALIKALNGGPNATALGNWLAGSFPYLYGSSAGTGNMTGKKNSDVAAYFVTLFNAGGQKADAQVMAGALACYVTSSTLAGTTASSYGFNSSAFGTGAKTYNVGSYGAGIGLSNNTSYTITKILQQANLQKQQGTFSKNASVWSGLFGSGINVQGDIQ